MNLDLESQKYTGFTLVELIVVMGIIAVLGTLGIQALTLLRQNIQFQQAETDIVTLIGDTRNRARNSVASTTQLGAGASLRDAVVEGFAIDFTSNNYSLRSCSIIDAFGSEQANCIQMERENIKPDILGEVNVFVTDAAKCRLIMFRRLSGDISALGGLTDTLDDAGTCTVRIQHAVNNSLRRDISIDLSNNSSDVF